MPDPKIPDRGAPAPHADILGDDARISPPMDGLPGDAGQPEAAREPAPRAQPDRGEARPGRDENQAGFLKEKDKPAP